MGWKVNGETKILHGPIHGQSQLVDVSRLPTQEATRVWQSAACFNFPSATAAIESMKLWIGAQGEHGVVPTVSAAQCSVVC